MSIAEENQGCAAILPKRGSHAKQAERASSSLAAERQSHYTPGCMDETANPLECGSFSAGNIIQGPARSWNALQCQTNSRHGRFLNIRDIVTLRREMSCAEVC